MTQSECRRFLIEALLAETADKENVDIPAQSEEQRRLLRALMNIRPAAPLPEEVLQVQDEYLRRETAAKGITRLEDLEPIEPGIYLWQGDITTLAVDAIVNAANSGMTGCYVPCHGCIDNAIHTYAGMQLRLECAEIMRKQGHEEETGHAKITGGYNLPCRYVLHTVGPIVLGTLTKEHEQQLTSCYRSCLDLAAENNCESLAFCCISTGEFHFPNEKAAEIAVETVKQWQARHPQQLEVIFNVFKDSDREIYEQLLG